MLLHRLLILCCLAYVHGSDVHCFDGPNYWCLNDTTESLCHFANKTVGLCGYSNKRCQTKLGEQPHPPSCNSQSSRLGDSFCKSLPPAQQQSPFTFNGGITGADEDLFSYYILSLYWPPSSCPARYNETLDFLRYFCSPYTDRGEPGSERLVLHGLWPTFATQGDYQGWPQFCTAATTDWSKCHINGNLCPWQNTTAKDFNQGDYEYCLSIENLNECLVDGRSVLTPEQDRLKVLAPGYLGPRNLFINHEWTKHGSWTSFGNEDPFTCAARFMLLVDIREQHLQLSDAHARRDRHGDAARFLDIRSAYRYPSVDKPRFRNVRRLFSSTFNVTPVKRSVTTIS